LIFSADLAAMSSKEEQESDQVGTDSIDIEEGHDEAPQSVPTEKDAEPTEFKYKAHDLSIQIVSLMRSSRAAVLNLIGSLCILFCSVGFTNAYGVFQEYYAQTVLSHKSPSEIAWIGSFNLFIIFAFALPVGYLNDLYGPRVRFNNNVPGSG
jgi:hypothetical protein